MFFKHLHWWLGAILLLAASCARPPAPTARLAVLRFENLSQDPSLDWMGRAFTEVVWSELAAVPGLYTISPGHVRTVDRTMGVRPVSAPGVSAEQSAALAAGANRMGYGTYWVSGGRLEARLIIQDSTTLKDLQVLSASAPADDPLAAAGALAHQLSNRAGAYATRNPQALKDYAIALEAPDASLMEAQANLAIASDPDFGPAYRLLVQVQAQRDREGALAVAGQALSRTGLRPADRVRLEIEAARLREDPATLQQGLASLAKLEPGDIETWQSLGQAASARHNYRPAMEAWEKVLAAEPENIDALNQLGYAAAYSGNLPAATAALRRYAALRPNDANALDSLGDVNLITGHLKEAEDYYVQAVKKVPAFYGGADWYKAAMARLMTGDVSGADQLAAKFTDARSAAHDPSLPAFNAQWQWISGRRKAAYAALEQFAHTAEAGPTAELASRAYSQLTVWNLILGDRAAAAQMSAKAAALAGPASGVEAAMARFLAQPPAPAAEWQARAARLIPNPAQRSVRDSMVAYALLLSGQFAPASEVLRRLYDSGRETDNEGLPVLLAWSLLETGNAKDAAPLVESTPVPPMTGPGFLTPFYFPRIFDVRARLAASQGRADIAQSNAKLFVTLSGSQ